MSETTRCHVLVAGGGPAGLAAAIALAERGREVVVVDPNAATPALSRCEMLPASASEIIKRLALCSVLDASVRLSGVISLWNTEKPVDYAASMPGLSGFGWSVDRKTLDLALRQRAKNLGVQFASGRVCNVSGSANDWHVSLSSESAITAQYLIDATGRPAVLARRLGATTVFGPDLIGITCNVEHPIAANLLAEAKPDGWWYALPRANKGGSIGFMSAGVNVRKAATQLTKTGQTLRLVPPPENHTDVHLCDSRMSRLFPTTSDGWLATGDAAVAFDPIASQGLFNALSSGFFAGNAAADAICAAPDAPQAYATLIERTASRSHRLIPHQYASRPYETAFWQARR